MFNRKLGTIVRLLILLVLASVVLVAPAAGKAPAPARSAAAKPSLNTPSLVAGPLDPNTDSPVQRSNASHRLIVELDSAPLATWAKSSPSLQGLQKADGRLNVESAAAQTYLAQLRSEQAAFVQAMHSAVPGAALSTFVNENGVNEAASYQIVFNGMSVDPGRANRDQARKALLSLPNVKNVYLDFAHATTLYTSTTLINAPALWNNPAIGGRAQGGAGIKFASVDGGIHKDAPMFSGTGYTYPPDFPPGGKGLTANNNGKIIASRVYFRAWDPPAPGDENPWPGEQGTSHGVHTSGIAAGNIVDAEFQGLEVPNISGVAPRAWVMSYRVFYASINGNESFYTTEGIAALEDVVADGADVVNNSWGEGPTALGGEFDALDTALINTNAAGVFVSMSAGNAGPGGATTDHPSDDYIIAAATTTSGTFAAGRVSVTEPTTPVSPTLQNRPFGTAAFGPQLAPGVVSDYLFKPAASVAPANVLGCNPFAANAFQGVAAVIERGVCNFSLKVFNAQQAGATFVVVYNSTLGGEAVQGMGAGDQAENVTISSIFVPRSMGLDMISWYAANGATSGLSVSTVAFQAGNVADVVIGFSSRGPGVGNVLKPDIAAPGVNILSQGYKDGATGEDRHLGFGQVSGTSMASPHVAGAAALLRQIHPTWSNAYIKSALMSTAKYTDIYVDAAQTTPAQPLDIGSGRLDLTKAASPGVILDPPSLSFGVVPNGTSKSIQVSLTSVASVAQTYNITTLFTGDGFDQTTTLPGFSVNPASVTLAPGQQKTITVTFNSATGQGLGENQGYIVLDGAAFDAHLAAWARVTYAQDLADVLIIDNDLSALDPNLGLDPTINYLTYYTRTLTTLGHSYHVWDVDEHAIEASVVPTTTMLYAYDTVILFTGDNFVAVLGQPDMDRLIEYINNGGTVIAMGQDLSAALGADGTVAAANAGDSVFLYNVVFGANWLQDSVTDGDLPTLPVAAAEEAPPAFKDLWLDLSASEVLLNGANERPTPVNEDTVGHARLSYFPSDRLLRYSIEIESTELITMTAAHIHAGGPEVAGGVLYTLYGGPPVEIDGGFTFFGEVKLSPADAATMLAGGTYINVHTTRHTGGEVRGQIAASSVRDGADNQRYIDEIRPEPPATDVGDPNMPEELEPFVGLLRYPGPNNEENGIVAVANRSQPSLESPGPSYLGRTIYTSFGLEGVNNVAGATSREDLFRTFFNWANDEPTASISQTLVSANSRKVMFVANVTSNITGTTGLKYRWDFGDGTPFTNLTSTTQASHTYQVCGTYTVRVEVTNSYGNRAIGTLQVNIQAGCGSRLFLPIVRR
jgi:subtilisin family serine protease